MSNKLKPFTEKDIQFTWLKEKVHSEKKKEFKWSNVTLLLLYQIKIITLLST